MEFSEMKVDLWIQHRNTLRASVIDLDNQLNPAFRVLWETGGTNWYPPEQATEFTPVPLRSADVV